VEGDVAAAVALEEFDATLLQEFGRCDDVRGFGIAAERNDRPVLEQQKHVADFFFFTKRNQLLLQTQTGCVVDGAELDD
jgi:hypothetical protein